jgi:hypothetical protein
VGGGVHQHIALLHLAVLHVDDVGDGIEPEGARNLQRHRQRNPHHRERSAQWPTLEISDHHQRTGAHPMPRPMRSISVAR